MKDLERNNIIFGAAYYPEYMPFERLQEDIAMMQEAGMNTVRIAESTWSTLEPVEGKFDFSYVDKVLAAVEKAGTRSTRVSAVRRALSAFPRRSLPNPRSICPADRSAARPSRA